MNCLHLIQSYCMLRYNLAQVRYLLKNKRKNIYEKRMNLFKHNRNVKNALNAFRRKRCNPREVSTKKQNKRKAFQNVSYVRVSGGQWERGTSENINKNKTRARNQFLRTTSVCDFVYMCLCVCVCSIMRQGERNKS